MAESGSGHKIPALAIKQSLLNIDNTLDIEVMDVAKELKCDKLDKFLKNNWQFILSHPILLTISYPFLKTRVSHGLIQFGAIKLTKRLYNYIRMMQQDLIFTSYFAYAQLLGHLKKRGKISVPTAVLVTDAFSPHRSWINRNNTYTILYSRNVKKRLMKYGLKQEQIQIMDFPLRPEFQNQNKNPKPFRKKLGLRESIFTVVLVSGGEGIGNLYQFIQPFIKENPKLQMVVICGKNEKLKKQLEKVSSSLKTKYFSLKVFGFVTNMHEFIAASDIMMGKSGISFMFESLIYSKPMIITQTLANERPALNFFLKHRVCWFETDPYKAYKQVIKVLENRNLYEQYVKNIKKLSIKNGSDQIALLLYKCLK